MLFTSETYRTIGASCDKIVLLPLGAVEQHGPHLGTGTDTDIVTSLATAAEMQRQDKIILAPGLPFGSSHHHLSFGGTISLSADLYVQVVTDLVRSLLQCGFRRIILLNGHGGNITPVKMALSMRWIYKTAQSILFLVFMKSKIRRFLQSPSSRKIAFQL